MPVENLDNPDSGSSTDVVADAPQSPSPADITGNTADIVVPQTWPDNWRQEMAGDDEKELKRLERMKSPSDVFKSYRELEKIKSSFVPAPKSPSKDSTPEEVKAYREAMGIPEDASGYNLDFEDGTVIGEDLRPQVEGFLKFAHETNTPPEQVKGILQWFTADVERQQEELSELNQQAMIDGTSSLKAEWGAEFKGNINSIQSLFVDAPEGVKDALFGAAGEDGLKFANNADNIKWLVGLAKQLNPSASLLPSGATDSASIDSELDKIKSLMHSTNPAEKDKYWKDPKMQERYQALLKAQSK